MRSLIHVSSRLAAIAIILLSFLPAFAAAQSSDEVRYYHSDAVGTVRVITDDTGTVQARYDYQPFGKRWPSSDPADPRMFAGKERDPDTELDYFGARYLRAESGRFITVDPVLNIDAALTDPQRWNRYSYAVNRPLTMIDPDGREAGYIYLPNGQMVAPIRGMTSTMGRLWGGTMVAGALIAAGPTAWRAAVGCLLSPACQSGAINILEEAASGAPTSLKRSALLDDAVATGRAGLSKAGRALQSHAGRGGWLAGEAIAGNAAENTKAAKRILETVLQSGQTTFGNHPTLGRVIRVRLEDGSGAWWKENGEFIGFLERYTPKR